MWQNDFGPVNAIAIITSLYSFFFFGFLRVGMCCRSNPQRLLWDVTVPTILVKITSFRVLISLKFEMLRKSIMHIGQDSNLIMGKRDFPFVNSRGVSDSNLITCIDKPCYLVSVEGGPIVRSRFKSGTKLLVSIASLSLGLCSLLDRDTEFLSSLEFWGFVLAGPGRWLLGSIPIFINFLLRCVFQ